MEDADVQACNEGHEKVNDFGREQEIRMAIPAGNARVIVRDGEIMYVLSSSLTCCNSTMTVHKVTSVNNDQLKPF